MEIIRLQRLGIKLQAGTLKELTVGDDGPFLLDGDLQDRPLSYALLIRLHSLQRLEEANAERLDSIFEHMQLSPGQKQHLYRAHGLTE